MCLNIFFLKNLLQFLLSEYSRTSIIWTSKLQIKWLNPFKRLLKQRIIFARKCDEKFLKQTNMLEHYRVYEYLHKKRIFVKHKVCVNFVIKNVSLLFTCSYIFYCTSLIVIFSIIRTLDYLDYFRRSRWVRIIEIWLTRKHVCCWLSYRPITILVEISVCVSPLKNSKETDFVMHVRKRFVQEKFRAHLNFVLLFTCLILGHFYTVTTIHYLFKLLIPCSPVESRTGHHGTFLHCLIDGIWGDGIDSRDWPITMLK